MIDDIKTIIKITKKLIIMKTKILISSMIFALSAYSFASPTHTDQVTNANEAKKISLVESLVSNSKGRNLNALIDVASSHSVSKHSDSLIEQSSIESKKGRNLDLQALALNKFMKAYDKQIAEQSF